MEIIIYGVLLIALAFLGSPLFSIIGAIGLIAFYAAGIDTSAIIVELYRLASAPTLIAIPLFTLAGYMLAESKTPRRLVALSQAFFGWVPGGLAVVALVSCAVFTAFTALSVRLIIIVSPFPFGCCEQDWQVPCHAAID